MDSNQTPATGWAQHLGHARQARDECAADTARCQQTEAALATAVAIERWVATVAAIRRLVDAYNAGVGRTVLTVVEQSEQPTVTVAAGGEGAPYLTATLDDTFIRMRARDAVGVPRATDFRLRSDRDDDATAAYVLQDWMQHL